MALPKPAGNVVTCRPSIGHGVRFPRHPGPAHHPRAGSSSCGYRRTPPISLAVPVQPASSRRRAPGGDHLLRGHLPRINCRLLLRRRGGVGFAGLQLVAGGLLRDAELLGDLRNRNRPGAGRFLARPASLRLLRADALHVGRRPRPVRRRVARAPMVVFGRGEHPTIRDVPVTGLTWLPEKLREQLGGSCCARYADRSTMATRPASRLPWRFQWPPQTRSRRSSAATPMETTRGSTRSPCRLPHKPLAAATGGSPKNFGTWSIRLDLGPRLWSPPRVHTHDCLFSLEASWQAYCRPRTRIRASQKWPSRNHCAAASIDCSPSNANGSGFSSTVSRR